MSAWGSSSFKSCNNLLTRVESNDPKLTSLYILPSKTFGSLEINRLAEALRKKNTVLSCISASGHHVELDALYNIGCAIVENGNIKSLAIGNDKMGNEGVVSLCRSFENAKESNTLEELDLGMKTITGSNVEDGSDAMAAIGRAFGNAVLKTLDLSRNESLGCAGLTSFCDAATTASLDDASNSKSIPFSSLEHFDLSDCSIGSNGLESFCNLLVCNNGDNSDEDKDSRHHQRPLLTLFLNSNSNITPVGLKALNSVVFSPFGSYLNCLKLDNCNIDDDGLEALLSFLNDNSSSDNTKSSDGLQILSLCKNNIGVRGAGYLANYLKCGSDLKELYLAHNPKMGSEGVTNIASSLSSTPDSTTTHNKPIALHTIDLSNTNCGSEGVASILQCSSLTTVRLFDNNLRSSGFVSIAPCLKNGHENIINLDLGGNRADDDSVACLLESLIANQETEEKEEEKKLESALRVLELGGNEIGPLVEDVLKRLEEELPELDVARDRPKTDTPDAEEIINNTE